MSCQRHAYRAERYINRGCMHIYDRPPVIYRSSKMVLSLEKICSKTIEDNLTIENVFNVILKAKMLRKRKLRERAKDFIWFNIGLMKEKFKNLEKSDSQFFEYVLQILLDVYRYKNPKHKYTFRMKCINDHQLYTKHSLTMEDLFLPVLENGLTEDNALVILMAAHKLNAQRVVDMTRRFLMRRRKCVYLTMHWGHLLLVHRKIFFIVAKIMFEIGFEYDHNVFNSFELKLGSKVSNYCSLCSLVENDRKETLMKKEEKN